MISNIKNVSILVSLLKEYEIKHIVLAPGASDIPIIHVIEKDEFFRCYSVVDERSMVYFAIGIAQQLNTPVACVCTSGTAVSNFLPGMTEAYYRNTPIIAITSDKDQYRQGQLETQKIEQNNIFKECCKKSVNLPVIRDEEEVWCCERLINEALIELQHHGNGPVHINIPVIGDITSYSQAALKRKKKIDLIDGINCEEFNVYTKNKINNYDKIMIVVGQDINFTEEQVKLLENFIRSHNAVIAVDHLSNVVCEGTVRTYPIVETKKELIDDLIPSLVISIGNNVASYDLKYILRRAKSVDHWQIDESGRIRDVFQHLTAVFECSISEFFSSIKCNTKIKNNYLALWKNEYKSITVNNLPYSSFYIARELSKIIPENSILHLAVLNSIRLMQYFDLHKGVKVYGNLGALGIDGCLSTFMGQAYSTERLAFCLLGDLSFFYDMNAAGIIHRKNNIRIILLNNHGAGEFYFTMGREKLDTIDRHIAAVNNRVAKGWVESLGYEYYEVHNTHEVECIMKKLGEKSDKPIFVEVFLDINDDTSVTKKVYSEYYSKETKEIIKDALRGAIGEKGVDIIKNIIRKRS